MKINFWSANVPSFEELTPYFEEIISTGRLSFRIGGKYVSLLEEAMKSYTGRKYAVAFGSATTALINLLSHAKFRDRGIVMPAFTFPATMNAAIWNRLKIRFADVDPETWVLDPMKVRNSISSTHNIVMPVNMFGNPPNYLELEEMQKSYDRLYGTPLYLLVDAAQSLGSKFSGYNPGRFGDAEIFSFSFTKIITGCEGGMLVTDNDSIYEHSFHGRHIGDRVDYNPVHAGIGSKMSELQASLAWKCWETLEKRASDQLNRADLYKQYLEDPNIQFQKTTKNSISSWKEFTILVPKEARERVSKALNEAEVEHRQYWNLPLNETTVYKSYEFFEKTDLPVTRDLCQRTISLPMNHLVTERDISYISSVVRGAI